MIEVLFHIALSLDLRGIYPLCLIGLMIVTKYAALEAVNLDNGAIVSQLGLVSANLNCDVRAVETDGISVYAYYTVTGATELVQRCTPNGNVFIGHGTVTNPLGVIRDTCFDGFYWYALNGTTVYQCLDPFFATVVRSWAHGVATANGIFYDGINIGVIGA